MCCGHICKVTGKKNVQSCVLHLSRLTLQKNFTKYQARVHLCKNSKGSGIKFFAWYIIFVPSLHKVPTVCKQSVKELIALRNV